MTFEDLCAMTDEQIRTMDLSVVLDLCRKIVKSEPNNERAAKLIHPIWGRVGVIHKDQLLKMLDDKQRKAKE